MDLKSVQEKLTKEFKGTERKLVFWYDDNAEFADEVDSIIFDNAKVYKLTQDNWFYTKYYLETVDKTNNYLVYAPFARPMDRDNHLADMVYYSKIFYADKVSLLMLDLKIPDRFKESLNKYPKFFKYNKYIDPFAVLGIENYNEEAIDIGVLSVLCGIKTPNIDEILRALLVGGEFENNKYMIVFEKMGILPAFWQLIQKYYGYSEEKPTLEKVIITLLITYTAYAFTGDLPKAWGYFISGKKNDVVVFMSNFMNNMLYKDQYVQLAEKIGSKIKVKEYMAQSDISGFLSCDTFPVFDELIIGKLLIMLGNECIDRQGLIPEITSIVDGRLKKYFAPIFFDEYKCIQAASRLVDLLEVPKVSEDIVEQYVKKLYRIDTAYRKFTYYFDKLGANDSFHALRQMIENIYTNGFLAKVSMLWADKLAAYHSVAEIPYAKQSDFYPIYVRSAIKKECTVVIISDALRYECAVELTELLNDGVQYTAEIDYMISSIPSYTKLGMATLLPHEQITFNENYDVLVDGQPSISTEQRGKILEKQNPMAVACLYSDMISFGREDLRKFLSGKELIYIYHDQIDARGDNSSTENEVFAACEETFGEIIKLVKKILVDRSITNYIITADHGFIYKRDKLDESDKVKLPQYSNAYQNKRFIIANEKSHVDGTLNLSLGCIGKESQELYVTVPRGCDIFKIGGGGQNYVHGGISLQELIVPVIKLKTARYKKETDYVEVVVISLSRKITNLITFIDFMQHDNVSDILLPVVMKIYFINDAGEKISNENLIYADKRNAPPDKRMFKEKFTFRNGKYAKSEKYYLVMVDDKTDVELSRYEFTIDITFSDDFGFGV